MQSLDPSLGQPSHAVLPSRPEEDPPPEEDAEDDDPPEMEDGEDGASSSSSPPPPSVDAVALVEDVAGPPGLPRRARGAV